MLVEIFQRRFRLRAGPLELADVHYDLATNGSRAPIVLCDQSANRKKPSGQLRAALEARQLTMHHNERILGGVHPVNFANAKPGKGAPYELEVCAKHVFEREGWSPVVLPHRNEVFTQATTENKWPGVGILIKDGGIRNTQSGEPFSEVEVIFYPDTRRAPTRLVRRRFAAGRRGHIHARVRARR